MTRRDSQAAGVSGPAALRAVRERHDTRGAKQMLQQGELLEVDVRLVLSPICGVFNPAGPWIGASEGAIIRQGDVVGEVHHTGGITHVRSWLSGLLMEMLVAAGERVHDGQPVAWVRALMPEALPGAAVPKSATAE